MQRRSLMMRLTTVNAHKGNTTMARIKKKESLLKYEQKQRKGLESA